MKRTVTAAAVLTILIVSWAAPAWAHEEINPSSVPTGRPVFLIVTAANEHDTDLVKLTLTAPDTLAFGATTRDPQGWAATPTKTAITWSGGTVKPGRFEQWGFEIEGADQPGQLTYKLALGFADGKTDNADVVLTATTAATPTPAATGSPTSITPAPDTAGAAPARSVSDSTARDRASLAVALGAVAVVAALAAVVLAARRRVPAADTIGSEREQQDW